MIKGYNVTTTIKSLNGIWRVEITPKGIVHIAKPNQSLRKIKPGIAKEYNKYYYSLTEYELRIIEELVKIYKGSKYER